METRSASAKQVSTALGRGAAFQALALAFAYPSTDVVTRLKARWSALLNSPHSWPADLRHASQQINRLLLHVDSDTLESEHIRLFGPAARCPLHETAYGDAGRLLGRPATLADIAGFYLAFDLRPSSDNSHPEDHLGLELEFMSLLAVKEACAIAEGWQEALDTTRTAQQRFIQDHLGTWTDAFTEQLRQCQAHPFYLVMGESLGALVHAEITRLQASPVPIGGPVGDPLMGGDSLQCPYASGSQEE